jgi:hypothetical protein
MITQMQNSLENKGNLCNPVLESLKSRERVVAFTSSLRRSWTFKVKLNILNNILELWDLGISHSPIREFLNSKL